MYSIHANDHYVLVFHVASLIHVSISFFNIQSSRYRSLLPIKYFLQGHHLSILHYINTFRRMTTQPFLAQ